MRYKDIETRYRDHVRHERKIREEYATQEIAFADDLLRWYKLRHQEIPDDEYRAAAFFMNREDLRKPGALTLLYSMLSRMIPEPLEHTKESAFNYLAYRFRAYAAALRLGGFD
jgi:hypothetical protein